MGEGHLRQGYLFGGKGMDGVIKAIGATHNEYDTTRTGSHPLAKPFGKNNRPAFGAVFIKQNHMVASLKLFSDKLSLLHLLLLWR